MNVIIIIIMHRIREFTALTNKISCFPVFWQTFQIEFPVRSLTVFVFLFLCFPCAVGTMYASFDV